MFFLNIQELITCQKQIWIITKRTLQLFYSFHNSFKLEIFKMEYRENPMEFYLQRYRFEQSERWQSSLHRSFSISTCFPLVLHFDRKFISTIQDVSHAGIAAAANKNVHFCFLFKESQIKLCDAITMI